MFDIKLASDLNQSYIRKANRSKILQLLYQKGSLARNQITDLIGLTASSVTRIVNECIVANIIIEQKNESIAKNAGRKPIPLSLNSNQYCVVGIHLGKLWIDIGLFNLKGYVVARNRQNRPHKPEEGLELIKKTIKYFQQQYTSQILTIGVTIYGQVDTYNGIILDKNVLGWRDIPIKSWLEEKLNIHTVLDTNVYSMAFTEYQAKQIATNQVLLFVSIGTTIGIGMVVNGVVIRGKQGMAGMFEYLSTINQDSSDTNETSLLVDPILLKKANIIAPELKIKDIHDLIRHSKSHPKLQKILNKRGKEAGNFLARLSIVHDPARIILSGSLLLNSEQQEVVKQAYWENIIIAGCNYAKIEFPSNKEQVPFPLIGAGTIAIYKALSAELNFTSNTENSGKQVVAYISLVNNDFFKF